MPFKMKGTAMYDKVKNDRGVSIMKLKSPMDKSPLEHENPPGVWHNDRQPNPGNPPGQLNPSHQHTSGSGSKLGTGKGETRTALTKSPMDKSPMDKSPMDHAHGAMNMSHMKFRGVRGHGRGQGGKVGGIGSLFGGRRHRSQEGQAAEITADRTHMKLKEDSAMDMSHMKLTQDAAMKLTSAMKKMSPMDRNAFLGALNAAKEKGDKTFNVDGKTYDVK